MRCFPGGLCDLGGCIGVSQAKPKRTQWSKRLKVGSSWIAQEPHRNLEIRDQKSEIRDHESAISDQKTENRNQTPKPRFSGSLALFGGWEDLSGFVGGHFEAEVVYGFGKDGIAAGGGVRVPGN